MEPHPSRCGRPLSLKRPDRPVASRLQWSRIQVDAEGFGGRFYGAAYFGASMEPHPSRCGRSCGGIGHGRLLPASMEPHPSRCGRWLVVHHFRNTFWLASMEPHPSRCGRYRVGNRQPAAEDLASMEPHPSRCGRGRREEARQRVLIVLQWSRIQVDAEGRPLPRGRRRRQRASMEPHPSRCGRILKDVGDAVLDTALQWSRIQVDAEGEWQALKHQQAEPLQWSRIQVDAEGSIGGVYDPPRPRASMEPHPSRCGRRSGSPRRCWSGACFNGAASK